MNNSVIYPNPTYNTLTLNFGSPIQGEIEIHNLNGQLIYKSPIQSTSKPIDISRFSAGIYFVTVRSEELLKTEKVVKL